MVRPDSERNVLARRAVGGPARQWSANVQRQRLLAASADAVRQRGRSVTVADVVQRSGVSRRTFYELFRGLEDCLLATFEEGLERAARYVTDADDPGRPWAERVRAALTALLSFLEEEPVMGRMLLLDSLSIRPEVLERRELSLKELAGVIDEGRRQTAGEQPHSPLTGECLVGGVVSVASSRLSGPHPGRLVDLVPGLMSVIVHPYLGAAAAARELATPVPDVPSLTETSSNPLASLPMRVTYRTGRVLMAVAANPGASNRELGVAAEVPDQGQISKLLARLAKLGLIENVGEGTGRAAASSWSLTDVGWEVHGVFAHGAGR
ncbi:MAG TPA: TetR family transcriptional regulator [Solirubrobacteraceae bacterium]|jgi:AcrR family transcriptional regulator